MVVSFGQTMAGLCRQLSPALDRDVVDRTGITGEFDLRLELTFAELFPQQGAPEADDAAGPQLASNGLAAINRAMQKLGLKIESAKAPGDAWVIERVERPSGN